MSVVLLIGAGLYVRSAFKAVRFDPGYDTSNGAMASVDLSMQDIDEAHGRSLLSRLLEGARRVPRAQDAALASIVPAAGPGDTRRVFPDDQTAGVDAHRKLTISAR
jgi:hypothetical protein